MVNINTFQAQDEDIVIEQVLAGKITELKIQGAIFAVKPDAHVDPIKAARDFLNAFDIKKTAMLRKVKCEVPKPEPMIYRNKQQKAVMTKQSQAGLETVARVNNIPIFKEYIVEFYKKYPDTFTGKDVIDFMGTKFKSSAATTLMNKQRAYIEFFRSNGWIEQIGGSGKVKRVYKFIEAPYGTEVVKAEYDAGFMQDMKERQLIAIRDQ
jgi:hypothetical protein